MQKISVISGGASGLGLEIAELLVKSGKKVLILGRNSEKLDEASNRLKKSAKSNIAGSLICNIGKDEDI
jgi:NADP-dependent 3-hydroxy acid dehydrogenase YdfG